MSRLAQRSTLGLALFLAAVACSPQAGEPARQPPLPDVQASGPSLVVNASAGAPGDMKGVEATPGNPAGRDVTVTQALLSRYRSSQHRLRDRYRHPRQTLEFFGLQPDMTVVELWPGAGWYTEILAQVLAHRGKLIVLDFDPNGPQDKAPYRQARKLEQRMRDTPRLFGKVQIVPIDPPRKLDPGIDGKADMVLTFRNFHNWIEGGYDKQVVEAAYKALKPGGVFGVVEHRARPGASIEETKKTGYVPEAYIIQEAEAVGFSLVAESDLNNNPKDTKDYPEGVWTLPPTLRLGDKDRKKYEAIGESDRMTLKFIKPDTARKHSGNPQLH